MTIAHDLSFSVLTAPIAQIDRRALSQAWYSALYPQHSAPRAEGRCAAGRAAKSASPPRTDTREAQRAPARSAQGAVAKAEQQQLRAGLQCERRAHPSALTKRITGAFYAARRTRHATLRFGGARVQIVLQQRASTVSIVAICSPKHASSVAQALQQARYALAGRGIALQTRTISAASEVQR